MMAHARQQLRNFIKSLLIDQTNAGSNVFANRVLPLGKDVTAVCLVYGLNEGAETFSMGDPVTLQRDFALRVHGQFKGAGDTLDDLMDDFAVSVETVLATDRSFSGLAQDSGLTRTTIQHDGQGEESVGTITLDYTIIYHTYDNSPANPL